MSQPYRAAVMERRPFVRAVLSTWSLPRPSALGFFRLAYDRHANSCKSEKNESNQSGKTKQNLCARENVATSQRLDVWSDKSP